MGEEHPQLKLLMPLISSSLCDLLTFVQLDRPSPYSRARNGSVTAAFVDAADDVALSLPAARALLTEMLKGAPLITLPHMACCADPSAWEYFSRLLVFTDL